MSDEREIGVLFTVEEIRWILNVLHADGHGRKSSADDFEPGCPSCTAAEKLESVAESQKEE